jgi:hypothetical protein
MDLSTLKEGDKNIHRLRCKFCDDLILSPNVGTFTEKEVFIIFF